MPFSNLQNPWICYFVATIWVKVLIFMGIQGIWRASVRPQEDAKDWKDNAHVSGSGLRKLWELRNAGSQVLEETNVESPLECLRGSLAGTLMVGL